MKVFVCTPLAAQKQSKVASNNSKMVSIAKAYLGKDIEVVSNYEKEVPDVSDNLKIAAYVVSQVTALAGSEYFVFADARFGFTECRVLKEIAECLGIPVLYIDAACLDFEEEKEDEKDS